MAVLGTRWREVALGRGRRAPRHAILDSQSVEARGLHGGKKIKGRSRHVAVDSQGTLLAVHICAANASDSSQAGVVMAQAKAVHPDLESFTADQGFRRQAQRAAHALDCELHVTHKPKKRASPWSLFAGRWFAALSFKSPDETWSPMKMDVIFI